MKVLPFKIPKPEAAALVYQVDSGISFYDKLHQHEELQLSYILNGTGTLIVGDTINDYKSGDVIVIGSQLPHVFNSDQEQDTQSEMVSLFFSKTSFGANFFNLEELDEITLFFKRARHGFKAISHQKEMTLLFNKLETASKLERFLICIKLLKLLSSCEYKSLSSFIYEKKFTVTEGERMRDVFEYTMSHFNKNITLDQVANVANMTKNAFCKYFKKYTNKTYMAFLNELRVEHACKHLLASNDITVSDVAYKVGFNNISNFNRQFKKVKHKTPLMYRKENIRR